MKIKIFLLVAFVLIACFIFGNSLLPPSVSGMISGAVKDALLFVFDGIIDVEESVGDELHFAVRKIAHFFEFAALGTVGALLLRFYKTDANVRRCLIAIIGLMFSLLDETLQIISARGSLVIDVWIDLCGYAFGWLLAALIVILRKKILSDRKKHT